MMPQLTVFISYSHKDKDLKYKLEKILLANGINALSDSKNRLGRELHKEISLLLNQSHIVLPIITSNWLNSNETRDEFVRAHERRKHIVCLLNSDDSIDEKSLPFFVKEDLRLHFTASTFEDKCTEIAHWLLKMDFQDFWKNGCFDFVRRIGDILQDSSNISNYQAELSEKKLGKVHEDLSNIMSDNYETNVSYEENFLRDASPYFKDAKKIYAVSIVDVSTFWTDKRARNAAINYLESQAAPDKDVIRLFVFDTPRQVHIFKKILMRNFHYYVLQKQNLPNFLSAVLVCSKFRYKKILSEVMQIDSPINSTKFEQDFGILTIPNANDGKCLEASLNSSNFRIKKINIAEDIAKKKFIQFLEDVVKTNYKYTISDFGISKITASVLEDSNKWNSMVDDLFKSQNTSDIFHVIYFKVHNSIIHQFEEIIATFISNLELNKESLHIKSISLRKFKDIPSAKDFSTRGELQIHKKYNFALSVAFSEAESLERYYRDEYHSRTRETLYCLLNPKVKQMFKKIGSMRTDLERRNQFESIERAMDEFILRVDWEQYDTENSITPFQF